jgi:preprotein translocase subunit SecD
MASLVDNMEQLANSLEAIDAQANEVVVTSAKRLIKTWTDGSGDLADDYFESFDVFHDPSGYFIVRFTPKNQEVNEEERGKSPYDMRQTMLQPGMSGVKVSKAGYLYRSVPLRKKLMSASVAATKSQGEQNMQQTIRNAIANAKFQVKTALQVGNRYVVEETADGNDGISRVKSYGSKEDYLKKRIPKLSFVAFRTISNNPKSKAAWFNPGWSGDNIQKKTQDWLQNNSEKIRVEVINELITMYLTGIGT